MKKLFFLLLCSWVSNSLFSNPVGDPYSFPGMTERILMAAPPPLGEITILFAYTTSAATSAGSPKNIKRNVDSGIAQLNEALSNNHINYNMKAVAQYVEVEYGAAPTSNDVAALLSELRNKMASSTS